MQYQTHRLAASVASPACDVASRSCDSSTSYLHTVEAQILSKVLAGLTPAPLSLHSPAQHLGIHRPQTPQQCPTHINPNRAPMQPSPHKHFANSLLYLQFPCIQLASIAAYPNPTAANQTAEAEAGYLTSW